MEARFWRQIPFTLVLMFDLSSESLASSQHSIPYHPAVSEKFFESLRANEYECLDKQNHIYLDYTGSGLASKTQLREHQVRLAGELCGNPHSQSPTSLTATKLVDETRRRVLQHFNASCEEYTVIFTANATGAAKLVGESYPFSPARCLVLAQDNHNSINGLREYARQRRCRTKYVGCSFSDCTIDEKLLRKTLRRGRLRCKRSSAGLFAFPGQSNFTGIKHPLRYVELAQAEGYDVLLDAAAFVPTNVLDLSKVKPEFITVSWYKVFGYPTGVGCLLARKTALGKLVRPWFSGGTVEAVGVGVPWHRLTIDESAFEDGTVNFQGIPDILSGLDWVQSVGILNIQGHAQSLASIALSALLSMKHSSGKPMTIVYGPQNMRYRGGCVAFNLLDAAGQVVDERIIGVEASEARISLRTGCFCNPGAGETIWQLQAETMRRLLGSRSPSFDEYIKLLRLPSAGAIRISFGIASTVYDVERLTDFIIRTYRDRTVSSEGLPPRNGC